MIPDSCVVKRLVEHGIEIVFPNEEEIGQLHRVILAELSNNIFADESRQYFVQVIQRLFDEEHVEGVILGCTGEFRTSPTRSDRSLA